MCLSCLYVGSGVAECVCVCCSCLCLCGCDGLFDNIELLYPLVFVTDIRRPQEVPPVESVCVLCVCFVCVPTKNKVICCVMLLLLLLLLNLLALLAPPSFHCVYAILDLSNIHLLLVYWGVL